MSDCLCVCFLYDSHWNTQMAPTGFNAKNVHVTNKATVPRRDWRQYWGNTACFLRPLISSFFNFWSHLLKHLQILCCLMWLFQLSDLACLKFLKSNFIPKDFPPDHHDGLHQLHSTVMWYLWTSADVWPHLLTYLQSKGTNGTTFTKDTSLWIYVKAILTSQSVLHSLSSWKYQT